MAEKHFETLIEMGKVRPIDVKITLRLISSTFLGLLVLRMMEEPVVLEQSDEFVDIFSSIVLDGIIPR